MGMMGFSYNLYPNDKQSTRMFAIAGATRFVYNWALDFSIKYYNDNKKFISANDITKELTKLKKETNTKWLTGNEVKITCGEYNYKFDGDFCINNDIYEFEQSILK